jgi:hypothetical protein
MIDGLIQRKTGKFVDGKITDECFRALLSRMYMIKNGGMKRPIHCDEVYRGLGLDTSSHRETPKVFDTLDGFVFMCPKLLRQLGIPAKPRCFMIPWDDESMLAMFRYAREHKLRPKSNKKGKTYFDDSGLKRLVRTTRYICPWMPKLVIKKKPDTTKECVELVFAALDLRIKLLEGGIHDRSMEDSNNPIMLEVEEVYKKVTTVTLIKR